MARPKGSKNKNIDVLPHYASLAPKDRVTFLANLIVDRIIIDQQNGQKLFNQTSGQKHARPVLN